LGLVKTTQKEKKGLKDMVKSKKQDRRRNKEKEEEER